MCSPSRSTATVPVACPNCRHEGPAYVYLLGRLSRCKMCGHNFPIPKHVRMGCPGCGFSLRVPSELIDSDVSCKFCQRAFRAVPALASTGRPSAAAPARETIHLDLPHDPVFASTVQLTGHALDPLFVAGIVASKTCPGEHAAISLQDPPTNGVRHDRDLEAELRMVQSEVHRLEQESQERAEQLFSLERALAGVLGEQAKLQAELRRSRTENETLASRGLEEIERLRAQWGRLEELRTSDPVEPPRPNPLAHPPHQPSRPVFGVIPPRTSGHIRTLTTRPPQSPRGSHGPHPGPVRNGSQLRESFDRLSHCEQLADGLIAQLKTTRQDKEHDREAIEGILERLQGEIATAKDQLEADRADSNPSTTVRECDPESNCGPMMTASPPAVESLA